MLTDVHMMSAPVSFENEKYFHTKYRRYRIYIVKEIEQMYMEYLSIYVSFQEVFGKGDQLLWHNI